MNTQHTPGPWHIEKHNKIVWQDSGGPGNETYATTVPMILIVHEQLDDPRLRTCVAQLDNSNEAEGNAKLIASAPELLNALELAKATIERLTSLSVPRRNSVQGTLDIINQSIAKAAS